MGKIISSKYLKGKKLLIKILTEKQELENIKGNLKKIHLFSEQKCTKKTFLKERGNNKTTKYLQIPMTLRPRKKIYKTLTYQKIESPKATCYIYGLITK